MIGNNGDFHQNAPNRRFDQAQQERKDRYSRGYLESNVSRKEIYLGVSYCYDGYILVYTSLGN